MAIVKMNKFTLFAFKHDKEKVLSCLQQFEGVQFINLQDLVEENDEENELNLLQMDSEEVKASDIEGEIAKVKFALDFLNTHIPKEKGLKVLMEGKRSLTYDELNKAASQSDYLSICDEVKQIEQRLSFLNAEIAKLDTEINTLKPWQSFDVSMDQFKGLAYSVPFLGAVPLNLKEKFKQELENTLETAYIESVSDSREGANFLIIVHKEELVGLEDILKKYGFTQAAHNFTGTCQSQIDLISEKVNSYKKEIEEKLGQIGQYKDSIPALEVGYEFLSNEINKARSASNFLKTENTVLIEGWVARDNSELLVGCIDKTCDGKFHIDITEPDNPDEVPILLKNNKFVKPFESFIQMYGLPNYNGIDPTFTIVPFYMLFYGMMLSDAVYGIVQFVLCAAALALFKLEEGTKNFLKLFLYLSIPTILVGALYGSWATGTIAIKPLWMDPSQNVILTLLVSFAIGLVQIFTGLGIKAYLLIKDGKPLDAFMDAGIWVITLSSSLIYLAGSFGKIAALQGILTPTMYVMFAGMAGIVLTQGRANKGIGAKIGAGIYELYGITGYIGDIVSYSRLMALGLATGFIGSAFNSMVDLLGNGIAAWIFGPLILLVGHVFNMFINGLGAYVHSLRLQYLEFFGKFYDTGGKPFTPFKSKSKFINIVKN